MTSFPTMASLTRISDLSEKPFDITPLDRSEWANGDYVVAEVVETSRHTQIELPTGRMIELTAGDCLVGAFGVRTATLEAVGSWQEIGEDFHLQAMTAAGLFGKITSLSSFIHKPMELVYRGHATRGGSKVTMGDFVATQRPAEFNFPILLLIGTSMSSGKTTSARIIIRRLKRMGLRVVGAKLTGAGRYRDVLSMSDAGADAIFDFVDVGLPSSVCDAETYRTALFNLLARITNEKPDVLVAEAGASPLEPYNGETALEVIHPKVRCTVLCASDPYAVVGVTKGFGFEPDLVAGLATSTSAGVEVVRRLAGKPALNLLNREAYDELDQLLIKQLMI